MRLHVHVCVCLCVGEMKVQCDGCEKAEASVMCCADEAALCADCDRRIHAANKLASKHQRLSLLYPGSAEELTCCDICQDKVGFFFCLEDRALLCRGCDYSIHSTNALTEKHKRFLVAGVRVALEASPAVTNESIESVQACPNSQIDSVMLKANQLSSPKVTGNSRLTGSKDSYTRATLLSSMSQQSVSLLSENHKSYEQSERCGTNGASPAPKNLPKALPVAAPCQEEVVVPNQREGGGFFRKSSISEYLTETIPGWGIDELLTFLDASSTQNFAECGSLKTDSWTFGGSEWHCQADGNAIEELLSVEGAPAQVPSLPSPTTACGVVRSLREWGVVGKNMKPSEFNSFLEHDHAPLVPDIGVVPSPPLLCPISPPFKQRRIGVDL